MTGILCFGGLFYFIASMFVIFPYYYMIALDDTDVCFRKAIFWPIYLVKWLYRHFLIAVFRD